MGGLVACGGKSADVEHAGSDAGTGGTAGSTAAGGAAASGGSGGSGGTSAEGGSGANGGAGAGATSGGSSGQPGSGGSPGSGGISGTAGSRNDAGSSSAQGGSGTDGGAGPEDGGRSGEAGAPANECSSYEACGCGCCVPKVVNPVCYYPDLGDTRDAIVARDQETAADPGCAAAGCSSASQYFCCQPGNEPDDSTYEATTYIGGLDRITLHRVSAAQRCTDFTLVRPAAGGTLDFPIVLPMNWGIERSVDYACADESSASADSRRTAFGGIGHVSWSSEAQCGVDFVFTLFFLSEAGAVEPVSFRGTDVAVPAFGDGSCAR